MASLLAKLYNGDLLTAHSTAFALQAMADCSTFPDRLKAGTTGSWKVAHKTGTSGTWNGTTAATNDVGILTSPDGSRFAVAVFLAESRSTSKDRAAAIARIASSAIRHYRP